MVRSCILALAALGSLSVAQTLHAQQQSISRSHQQARAQMRPIGSPSATDQYLQALAARQGRFASQDPQPRRQQTVRMQNGVQAPPLPRDGAGISLPNSNLSVPSPTPAELAVPPTASAVPSAPPGNRNLPAPNLANPADASAPPAPRSPSDLARNDFTNVRQPSIQDHGFATLNNCNCVSGPSGYTAACVGCGANYGGVVPASCNQVGQVAPGYLGPGYAAPPAELPAPAIMPPASPLATGGGLLSGNSLPRAVISLGQQLNQVQVGQGLWGQPVAYVPGQSVRNWIRYFFP